MVCSREVTVVHRRNKFRAHEHSIQKLMNSTVKVKTPYNIKEVIGNGEKIESIALNGEAE